MTREEIIEEIKQIATDNNGVPPGKQKFHNETGISDSVWEKYWARWGDALCEAGFTPNVWQVPHEEEFLIESYIRLIREIGRFPTVRELRLKRGSDPKFPSRGPFSRLGSKSSAASRIVEFCRARGGYEDVIKVCEPLATASAARTQTKGDAAPELGFVYLLKSGRHYKIG